MLRKKIVKSLDIFVKKSEEKCLKCLKSVYLIATRDLSNLWLQFFLSQNQEFMRSLEITVLNQVQKNVIE